MFYPVKFLFYSSLQSYIFFYSWHFDEEQSNLERIWWTPILIPDQTFLIILNFLCGRQTRRSDDSMTIFVTDICHLLPNTWKSNERTVSHGIPSDFLKQNRYLCLVTVAERNIKVDPELPLSFIKYFWYKTKSIDGNSIFGNYTSR